MQKGGRVEKEILSGGCCRRETERERKSMKKLLCCILAALTLGAGALTTACGGSGGNPSTATSSESSASSSSSESEADMTGIVLKFQDNQSTYDVESGQTVRLALEFTKNGAAQEYTLLTFSSEDPSVATVDGNGYVTGVASGTTKIAITYGTITRKATIRVVSNGNSVLIEEKDFMLAAGDTKALTAKAYIGLAEQTDAVLSWESSDDKIATVENGVVTGVANGSARITVRYEEAAATVNVSVVAAATKEQVNTFDEKYVNLYGRTYVDDNGLHLDGPATAVEVGFIGTSLQMTVYSTAKTKMRVYVDGDLTGTKTDVAMGTKAYTLASGLADGYHTARIVKASEEQFGQWDIEGFDADGFFTVPENTGLKIEFIGTSDTTGYAIGAYASNDVTVTAENSDATMAYAYLTAQALGAKYSVVAKTGICTTVTGFWAGNYCMAGLYSCVSERNSANYAFDFRPDIIVVNLGTIESSYILRTDEPNSDPTYGSRFQSDYAAFLAAVRQQNPQAYIICLYGMMNKNVTIHLGIQGAVEEIIKGGDTRIVYNPFAIEQNNLGGINHPNAVAHRQWAEDLTAYIRTLDI